MTLFSLPLSWQNGRISVSASSFPQTSGQSTNRKRKRTSPLNSPAPPSTLFTLPNSAFDVPSSPAPSNANLDYVNSNPLSLNADETRQYRAAGLELDKELPSKTYTAFPHRNLPWEAGLATDDEERQASRADSGAIERGSKPSHLKVRHLGVLTAILQRCLAEGDIPRATKAWALLLRAEVGGKGVDLRSTGYWSLGAELLIRRGEQLAAGSGSGEDGTEEAQPLDPQDSGTVPWGTSDGLERAKDYYARLILQHPYKRQYSTATSALDFWPAMLSCEIYGIQSKQQQSLQRLDNHQGDGNNDAASDHDDSLSEDSENSGDDSLGATQEEVYFARLSKRESRTEQRQQRKTWKKREEVRIHAKNAAEKVAQRMDEIMTTPPYVDSHVLHRLRGCLALYIGDLSVLTPWEDNVEGESEKALAWARRAEAERGKLLKKEMIEVARAHFDVARRRGGDVPEWEAVETTLGYD
ncbi:hypothetical protein V494_04673 [Pseudogymnoascus sp. VKM F-4513 (FW-928)]|nr:hypothetical protein V494_04673 [Pseudogymnoascus sp. VKM F-4513 (FW-928)]